MILVLAVAGCLAALAGVMLGHVLAIRPRRLRRLVGRHAGRRWAAGRKPAALVPPGVQHAIEAGAARERNLHRLVTLAYQQWTPTQSPTDAWVRDVESILKPNGPLE